MMRVIQLVGMHPPNLFLSTISRLSLGFGSGPV